jgi:hypothetical protein
MAAGLGLKTFVTGDVLTAADTNGYLMQGVWVFADAAARTAAVTSPQEGNMSYLKDTNSTEYYSGSAWVAVAGASGGMSVIYSGSLSSTSTLISGIPATYKDLVLEIRNYTTTVSGWAADIRMNDDSAANRHFTTSGVPIGTGTAFNDTKILMTADNGNVSSSSNSLIRVTIPSYTNTTTWKLVSCQSVTQVTATPTNFYYQDGGGIYNQTAAISSLRILPNSAATIGGTYILYGVN